MNLEIYAFALNSFLQNHTELPRKSLITTQSAMPDQRLSGITSSVDLWDVLDCTVSSIEEALHELRLNYNGFAYTQNQIKAAHEEFIKLITSKNTQQSLRGVLQSGTKKETGSA